MRVVREYSIHMWDGTFERVYAASVHPEDGGQLSCYGYDSGPEHWGIYLIRIYGVGEWKSVRNVEGEIEAAKAYSKDT